MIVAHDPLRPRVRLARRGCVNRVKLVAVRSEVFQRVRLDELERVTRLRVDVHADDLEPGPVVSHGRATLAAEQVK